MHLSEFVQAITCTFMHGFQNNFGTVVLEVAFEHYLRYIEGQGRT